jgi:hypothetical protein
LICAALLDTERSAIVENKYGFTEILKHVNDLAHRIDLQKERRPSTSLPLEKWAMG